MENIAKTILMQLGGNHFVTMVGARNIYSIGNGLRLDFMKNASKANRLKIILRDDDTYTFQLWDKGRNVTRNMIKKYTWEEIAKLVEPTLIYEAEGVYCDMLRGLFENKTKLRTSLTHIYGDL